MKRRQLIEPDLCVVHKKLSDKEAKEISDFIKEYKKKEALKKAKHRKAAQFFSSTFLIINPNGVILFGFFLFSIFEVSIKTLRYNTITYNYCNYHEIPILKRIYLA